MELMKNMVYEWTGAQAPNSVERVLWLDQSTTYIWIISVYNSKAQPLRRNRAELEASLGSGEARLLPREP
jgi:hypothetical protein